MTAARAWLPLVVLLGAAVVVAALTRAPAPQYPPLDPDSPLPDGLRGLVVFLQALDAHVDPRQAVPARTVDVAFLAVDNLNQEEATGVRDWVESGGVLVVADAASVFAPQPAMPTGVTVPPTALPKECALPALRDVQRVGSPGVVAYRAPGEGAECFPLRDGHWLTAQEHGAGVVVALGAPLPFTNAHLDAHDNALLAAALLAPRPGTSVALLAGTAAAQPGLVGLLPLRARVVLWQLAVAFAALVAWRARRLGQPVLEPAAVAVPGSELVVAVGNLLHQTRARGRAVDLLRDQLRRVLRARFGLPADGPDTALAAAVAARSSVPSAVLARALEGDVPADEGELVRAAQELETLRRAALGTVERSTA